MVRMFCRSMDYRRIAIHCDKLAANVVGVRYPAASDRVVVISGGGTQRFGLM